MFSPFRLSTTVLMIGALSGFPVLARDQDSAQAQDRDSQDRNSAPQQTTTGGWRQFGSSPNDAAPTQGSGPQAPAGQAPAGQPFADPPAQLTIPAGTWISVRTDQALSSDHNQPGDAFTATLAQPLVASGFVVARRGQTISGRVVEAVKAGKVKGTSHLGLELTDIALVDGQQLPVRTQLIQYSGGTSQGRDAAAIGTTTAIGRAHV